MPFFKGKSWEDILKEEIREFWNGFALKLFPKNDAWAWRVSLEIPQEAQNNLKVVIT